MKCFDAVTWPAAEAESAAPAAKRLPQIDVAAQLRDRWA
jgi:hypothetical protein